MDAQPVPHLEDRMVNPAAALFPLMSEAELRALAEDIKRHGGLLHPVVIDDHGRVLDGRNRLLACEMAEVEPEFTDPPPGVDPLAYVVSVNVARRHLSAGQKAVAAAEGWDLLSPRAGAKRATVNRAQALGAMFGVSKTYVEQARALLREDPEAAARVKAGDAELSSAIAALDWRKEREADLRARGAATTPEEQAVRDRVLAGVEWQNAQAAIITRVGQEGGWLVADVDRIREEQVAAWEAHLAEEDELGGIDNLTVGVIGVAAMLRKKPLATFFERRRAAYGDEKAAAWMQRVRDDAAWIAEQAGALLGDPPE